MHTTHRSPVINPKMRRYGWLLVALGLLAAGARANAAQNPPSEPLAAAPAAPMLRSYTPKPSQTLDQVIAQTMPGSPLKIELLRQAFIAHNPQAIQQGKTPKLRKGAVLSVPDHDELLRQYLGSRAPVAEAVQTSAPLAITPSTSEERRRWVQFP